MKIVAKVKTVVGKLKKMNKDKSKRFKRAPHRRKKRSAPILESKLGKIQNKPLLMKIVAKVKTVVGKTKKTNKDKSKRFKRAPFTTWPTPKPGQALTRITSCKCSRFCLFSKCLFPRRN